VLLQRAWNKYGESAFEFSVLEETPPDMAVTREQHYIDTLDSANANTGFNICRLAGSVRGTKHSQLSRIKMSKSQKLRPPMTAETRQKISLGNTGKKMSPEAIEKTRQAHIGKKYSEEQRRANSERNRGKKLPAEHLEKLRKANTGKIISEETRNKIGEANRGKKRSAEIRLKMTGVKRTEESRARMAAAQKGKKQSPEIIAKRVASRLRTLELRRLADAS
jgi:hypothetical protein